MCMGGGLCRSVVDGALPTLLIGIRGYGPVYEMSSSLTWDSTGE